MSSNIIQVVEKFRIIWLARNNQPRVHDCRQRLANQYCNNTAQYNTKCPWKYARNERCSNILWFCIEWGNFRWWASHMRLNLEKPHKCKLEKYRGIFHGNRKFSYSAILRAIEWTKWNGNLSGYIEIYITAGVINKDSHVKRRL